MGGVVAITGEPGKLIARIRVNSEAQRKWAKGRKWSRYVKGLSAFQTSELGENAKARIEALEFDVAIDPKLGISTLEEALQPSAKLAEDGRTVLVYPGLAGFDDTKARAGLASAWDKGLGAFLMPLEDAHREGIRYAPEVTEAFSAVEGYSPVLEGFEDWATELGAALSLEESETPDWMLKKLEDFERPPFPHQVPAGIAALLGHRFIADPPGVGKTSSSLIAAHLSGAERIVVVSPPGVVTHWAREAKACSLDDSPTVVRAGRKEPAEFSRVTVVPDSLLAARPELLRRFIEHAPQVLIVDEAHRMKTLTSKRSRAIMSLSTVSKVRIPLTGTPVESGPHELAALLAFTGHLLPMFGGVHSFIEQFCTVDRYGKLHPRKRSLGRLNELLFKHVWVRRKKAEVLPMLPERFIPAIELDVDLRDYNKEMRETVEKISEQIDILTDPDADAPLSLDEARDAIVGQAGSYISALRVAAARLKLPWLVEHLAENASTADPIIVWLHHRELAEQLSEMLEAKGVVHESYLGGLSTRKQDQIVDDFQAGKVPVLIAGITAAGVGLTLTRGNRAIFLESHWAPSLMSQAMDRCHRIGQTRDVIAEVTVSLGTIDERIQKILLDKGKVSSTVQGDDQDDVAVLEGDTATPRELVEELIDHAISLRG